MRKTALLREMRDPRSDWHPINILDINLKLAAQGDECDLPGCIKEISLGHIMQAVLPEAVGDQFDFVTGISTYFLISEARSQTQWHVDFTGTSVFYAPLSDPSLKHFWILPRSEKNLALLDELEQMPLVRRW